MTRTKAESKEPLRDNSQTKGTTQTLHIDDEFRRLISPLTREEYEGLEKSILREGCRDAIVVWRNGNIILDGHNRYEICQRYRIPFRTIYRDFPTRTEAKLWILQNQLARRNLTDYLRGIAALEYEQTIAEIARDNQGKRTDLLPNLAKSLKPIDTREEVARLAGLSHGTLDKVRLIREKATEEEKVKLSTPGSKLSIHQIFIKIRQRELRTDTPPFPNNKFGVIYADPPYRFQFVESQARAVENNYPTMIFDDLAALPISSLAADDCVLFLWAPAPIIEQALQLASRWGFTYRSCGVWVKDKIGMGYYFRNQHELLLIAVKGNPPVPRPENRHSSVINAPRTEHSRKPDEVYEVIERMYPNFTKIELFARQARKGWTVWGNQAPNADDVGFTTGGRMQVSPLPAPRALPATGRRE
jgi:N6-adenosine-specific RNA methylase IME4